MSAPSRSPIVVFGAGGHGKVVCDILVCAGETVLGFVDDGTAAGVLVLGLPVLGVTDNFFALGGHSLLAVRLFAALEKEFGKKLPLTTLLQSPTIRQFAEVLTQPQSWSALVPLQPVGNRPPFFCVHAVGGNVLEYYDLAQQMRPDQPFYGLQAVGLDGQQKPLGSIAEMAAQYLREVR